jgi:hypothetical protein
MTGRLAVETATIFIRTARVVGVKIFIFIF